MSKIKFDNLKSVKETLPKSNALIFTDVSLDFKINESTKDLVASYDENAIKNSLTNLLNTKPGENFLFPDFGLNLNRSLFEPMSEYYADVLGGQIVKVIEKYEPRVYVLNVGVGVNIDRNEYNITIEVVIPNIQRQIQINYSYTEFGFVQK